MDFKKTLQVNYSNLKLKFFRAKITPWGTLIKDNFIVAINFPIIHTFFI